MIKRLLPLIIIMLMLAPNPALAKPAPSVTVPNGGPTFWVHEVDRNNSVTISVTNFPPGKKYNVTLGLIGNAFGSGYNVGALQNRPSSFRATFKIPGAFRDEIFLGIQLKNPVDGSRGYNIFQNTDGFDSSTPLWLTPVKFASTQTVGTSVAIYQGPTVWIQDVTRNKEFVLKVQRYTNGEGFKIFVGDNSSAYQGIWAGGFSLSSPKNFTVTVPIPGALWSSKEIKVVIQNNITSHAGVTAFTNSNDWRVVAPYGFFSDHSKIWGLAGSNSSATPFMNILNVVQNAEVTIQAFNFPPDKDFLVTMGLMGSQGIGGIVIGTQNSGAGGSFLATYPIPAQLQSQKMISIRMQSTTSKHFAYDFFENRDGYNGQTATSLSLSGDWVLPAGTYPSTSVVSVIPGVSVTLSGFNFTNNDSYTVRMGAYGTAGVGGIVVATHPTGPSDNFTATFNIPDALKSTNKIAIRLESNNTAYFAFDWFNNQ